VNRLHWTAITVAALMIACGGSSSQVLRESLLQPEEGAAAAAVSNEGSTQAVEGQDAGANEKGVATPAPGLAKELTAQGVADLKAGRLGDGRDALLKAVDTGYADAVVYYDLALAQMRLGDPTSAANNARAAVKMSRGSPKAVKLVGTIMLSSGRAGELRDLMNDVIQDNPDSLAARNMLARAEIALGKAAKGLRDASQLLKKDQTSIEVMKTIARAYLAMNREEAAKLVLNQTLELKRDAEVLDLLGQMAARAGEKRKAIAYFQEAIGLDPSLADAHNNLGVLFQEAGDYESALKEFQSALTILPSYSRAYMNMGNAYRKMMRFSKAEAAYRSALKIDPDCADCYFNMGVNSLENKGAGKDGPEHYRKAMEYFSRYMDLLRGPPPRGDEVEKYMDEARRMAKYMEKEASIKEEPEEEPAAEPDEGADDVNEQPDGDKATPAVQDPGGAKHGDAGDDGAQPADEEEEEWVD